MEKSKIIELNAETVTTFKRMAAQAHRLIVSTDRLDVARSAYELRETIAHAGELVSKIVELNTVLENEQA